MSEIITEYKGFKITFDEFTESWKCEIKEGSWSEKVSLKDIKKSIDLFLKKESEFKDTKAITLDTSSWRGKKFGSIVTITSVADDGDVWIRTPSGEREKIGKGLRSSLCSLTDENKVKLAEIFDLGRENEKILSKIDKVKDSMEKIFKIRKEAL